MFLFAVDMSSSASRSGMLIHRLLRRRCPSAVVRFVVAIGIGVTVQTFAGRTQAHIFEEVFESIPSRIDLDSSSSVSSVVSCSWIQASRTHCRPRRVFGGSSFSFVPMCGERTSETSTRRNESGASSCRRDDAHAIACTTTIPKSVSRTTCSVSIQESQPSDNDSCHVDCGSGHSRVYRRTNGLKV